jgi:hypothetical protein
MISERLSSAGRSAGAVSREQQMNFRSAQNDLTEYLMQRCWRSPQTMDGADAAREHCWSGKTCQSARQ